MERKVVVYVAGQITGLPDGGKSLFAMAQQHLEEFGYVVINPTLLPEGMDKTKYMPICLAMVQAADVVFLLPNWVNSTGANIEFVFARYQGKPTCTNYRELIECLPPYEDKKMYASLMADTIKVRKYQRMISGHEDSKEQSI